jgi:uncharacterized protein
MPIVYEWEIPKEPPIFGHDFLDSIDYLDRDALEAALINAARSGDLHKLTTIMARGIHPNDPVDDCWQSSLGTTPLMAAASSGSNECLTALITAGADVDMTRGRAGNTACIAAAQEGHLACLSTLIAAGADLEARPHDGYTAGRCPVLTSRSSP